VQRGNRFDPVENNAPPENWQLWRKGDLLRLTKGIGRWGTGHYILGVEQLTQFYTSRPVAVAGDPVIYFGEHTRIKQKIGQGASVRLMPVIQHLFFIGGQRFICETGLFELWN